MGIVLFLLGVAIAPNINFDVVKASLDDDLVGVTTQACGVKGCENTTVHLTRSQYQNLQLYVDTFRERINHTTTREEAVPLFNEAVVELNKYGLLPKGMSVAQAQRLVTGGDPLVRLLQSAEKTMRKSLINYSTNSFCLVAGYSNITVIYTLFQNLLMASMYLFFGWLYKVSFILYLWMMIFLVGIVMVFVGLGYLIPFTLWSSIYFYDGTGFLFSLGLGGFKKWVGTLHGKITGFTGIKILLNLKDPIEYFYLGSAVHVEMR
ncbi:MAG TPA: hypothetical protein VMT57_09715 [Candidatus Thermoplasmatota archaeon]|nr:hypothetical protein [Candidatus Thermoplasmatota archaeon]